MSFSAEGERPRRDRSDQPHAAGRLALVVLISGRGSNLQAIIDAIARGELPATIRAVISNRPKVPGLDRARCAGIPTEVVDSAAHPDRASYEKALAEAIDRHRPDLLVLAGFMRILSEAFVRRYDGRILNIHPSLLPEFSGLDTHRRAIEAGVAEHGASVHFVTRDVDGGPVVLRGKVPILESDTPASLAERVLAIEHRIYPIVIRWFAEGRLRKQGDRVLFDGRELHQPLDYDATAADRAR
jgi:phosphoribosylglycinamide formyltransferase-1